MIKIFDNIGNKIKVVTESFCWIGIIGFIILGIVLIKSEFVLYGLLVIVLGSFFCWLASLLSYGMGELIEDTDKQIKKTEELINLLDRINNYKEQELKIKENINEDDLLRKIKKMETYDLFILFQDEKDRYTENQRNIIKKELEDRRKRKA